MDNRDIPYIVYEGSMMRFERHIRRLVIVIIILILLLFGTNGIWLYEWTRYDYSDNTTSYEQDGETNIIGDGNDVAESNN